MYAVEVCVGATEAPRLDDHWDAPEGYGVEGAHAPPRARRTQTEGGASRQSVEVGAWRRREQVGRAQDEPKGSGGCQGC